MPRRSSRCWPPPSSPRPRAKFRGAHASKLQREIERLIGSPSGPPGIAVFVDGRHREFFSAGIAGGGQVPSPAQRFRIASVSKGFNAYVAAKLGSSGLSFETTLGSSIPGVLPAAEAVTMRQLLQHTSGLAEYIQAPAFGEQLNADPSRYFSPTELTGFVRDAPLEFAPGSKYHYSDTDNIAAALMEEKASGLSYQRLLAKLVFKPLGMRDSSLPVTAKMPRPFLHGYDVEPPKKPEDVSELLNPAGAWASGGIVSTPLDLSRFVRSYVPTMLRAGRGLEGPSARDRHRRRGRARTSPASASSATSSAAARSTATPAPSPATASSSPPAPTASARSSSSPTPRSSRARARPGSRKRSPRRRRARSAAPWAESAGRELGLGVAAEDRDDSDPEAGEANAVVPAYRGQLRPVSAKMRA